MCEVSIPEHSKKRWCRAPAPALDAKKDAITFQQMDTDYYIAVRPHGAPRQVLRHYVHEGAWRRARARAGRRLTGRPRERAGTARGHAGVCVDSRSYVQNIRRGGPGHAALRRVAGGALDRRAHPRLRPLLLRSGVPSRRGVVLLRERAAGAEARRGPRGGCGGAGRRRGAGRGADGAGGARRHPKR